MHSSPQFTRSTVSGKFTWVRAIKFGGSFMVMGNFPVGGGGAIFAGAITLGGISLWPTFLDEILLGESMVLLVFKGERKKFSKTWVT